MKPTNILKKKLYNYVPVCPCCNSRQTGHYITASVSSAENRSIMKNALKNGEIIDFVNKPVEKNCFCLNCEYIWQDVVLKKIFSSEEIKTEKMERDTEGIYKDLFEEEDEKLANAPFVKRHLQKFLGL